MGIDKRKYPRRKLGTAACVTWPIPLPCTVADISGTGARLRSRNIHKMPDVFDLALNKDMMRKCQIVWRTRDQVGVRFLPPRSSGGTG